MNALALTLLLGTQPIVVVPQQPVQVQFPLFTVSGKQYTGDNELIRQLLEEVRQLRQEVAQLRGGQAVNEPKDFASVVTMRCAACHKAADAELKGGGFVLLEDSGKLPPLSLDEKASIVAMVKSGKMPKNGKLPEREVKLLLEGLLKQEE